ncbi:DUF1080 domain-containing protein [Akkermansiaceae bacterium]|nr:DUF1080 domain-containing protein [Akkermansiaceae bacterium]|tara:strand:+ start:288 stop:890 length:603 start_codon:yes stop_codon:yes gene_type:complete
MKLFAIILIATASLSFAGEWVNMFDGKTMKGWKVNPENPETFSVKNGAIKVQGKRGHLFYGEDGNAKFKNFEFECEVKTAKKANAGIFIHTKYQDNGWPSHGYECQVNATHGDWRKTGSIYSFQDLKEPGHKDGEWFTYNIKVESKKVTVTINGKVTNEYTEADDHTDKTKRLSEGTIALQGHDPGSLIYFRKLRIKKLD